VSLLQRLNSLKAELSKCAIASLKAAFFVGFSYALRIARNLLLRSLLADTDHKMRFCV
jgi:hypothetical protein